MSDQASAKRRVLVFGAFDPLHEGHRHFLKQAAALGEHLLVVVARDDTIRAAKSRQPYWSEAERLAQVGRVPEVDEVKLGDREPAKYCLLKELDFEVLALGYDQQPSDKEAQRVLGEVGKKQVAIVRLKPYKPRVYKSTYVRK